MLGRPTAQYRTTMIGVTIARFLLIFLNGAMFAIAIVLLVSGLTIHTNNYTFVDHTDTNYAQVLHVVKIPDVIGNTAIFLATAGGVSLVFSIIGCCAAAMYSRCAFLMYWIVLILLALFEIAVIIYVIVYPEQRKIDIKEKTYESLKQHFKPVSQIQNVTWKNLENFRSEDSIEDYWLMMEMRYNCCGANSYLDYQTFFWNNITEISGHKVSASVPIQCCKDLREADQGSPVNITKCLMAEPKHIHTEGCSETVITAVRVFGNYAVGLIAIVIGIQVILLSSAIYLWMKISQPE